MALVSSGTWWVQASSWEWEDCKGVGALLDSSLPSGIFEDRSLASACSIWLSNWMPQRKASPDKHVSRRANVHFVCEPP